MAQNPVARYGTTDDNLKLTKDEPVGVFEHIAPYLAEFVGTFLIVFTMCCCPIVGEPMWNPTCVAFIVMVAVYSFMPVSGAHLNPAVTLALGFVFKFPWAKALAYILMQIAGACAGSLVSRSVFTEKDFTEKVKLGPRSTSHFQWYDIGVIEAVYTFTLCFVFMSCVTSVRNNKADDQNHFFGLAIGFVYIAGGYPSLDISGSIFNPAAALAIGISNLSEQSASQQFYWISIYVVAQAAGAWLASIIFLWVRPEDFKMQYDGKLEEFEVPVRAKLMGELVGSFMIVLTVGLNLVMVTPAAAWSFAACYTCFVYSLGDVSGGHFNPAVTLAVMLSRRGKCSVPLGQSYIFNQLLGGVGAGVVYAHFNLVSAQKSWPLQPQNGYGWANVGAAETLFTAVLAWIFLSVATTTMPPSVTETNFYFGLAVGSCVTVGGFAIGSVSGWNMNPAVAVGRGVNEIFHLAGANGHILDKNWAELLNVAWYSTFEFTGGIIAAVLFFLTHQRDYLKDGSGEWAGHKDASGVSHIP